MTASRQRWIPSSQRTPCPICGRVKDGDCRIGADGDAVVCHRTTDLKPGEVFNGWAFTGTTSDGRGGHFVVDRPQDGRRSSRKVVPLHRPRKPRPARFPVDVDLAELPEGFDDLPNLDRNQAGYGYGPTQRACRNTAEPGGKVMPWHLKDGGWINTAGPAPWPLFQQEHACSANGAVLELEGERCVGLAMKAGFVAITQPGHDHKPESIARRYALLEAAGVPGVVYISDNDAEGARKAERCADAAASVGLPFLHLPAATVWPGIVEKGSIDDAPGYAVDHWTSIRAAFRQAVADLGEADHDVEDLGDDRHEVAGLADAAPIDQWEAAIRAALNPEHPSHEQNSIRRQINAATLAAELGLRVSPAQTRQRILQIQRAMVTGDTEKGTAGGERARIVEKEWLVDGLIAKGCLTGVAAFNKVGKTKMAARLAADLIFGRPFLGRFPVAPGGHRIVLWWVDQPAADSAAYLRAVGLMEPDGTLHPQIVRLYTEEDDLAWDDAGADLLMEHAAAEPGLVLITDSFFHSIQRIYGSDQEPEAGGALIDVQTLLAPYGVTHVCLFHSPKDTGPIGIQAIRGHGSAGGAVSACISLHFMEKRCPLKKVWIADKENPHRRMVVEGRAPFQDLLIRGDFERGTFEVVGDYQKAIAELLADEKQAQKVGGLTEEQRQVLEAMGGLNDPKGSSIRDIAKAVHGSDDPPKSRITTVRKQCQSMARDGLIREDNRYGITLYAIKGET